MTIRSTLSIILVLMVSGAATAEDRDAAQSKAHKDIVKGVIGLSGYALDAAGKKLEVSGEPIAVALSSDEMAEISRGK
jgi:hypothetical protein